MKKKNRYVQRETLTKIKARYIILLGQRSNGKSWSVKEDVIKMLYIIMKSSHISGDIKRTVNNTW